MKNVKILYLDANPFNFTLFRRTIESLNLPISVTALTVTPSAQDALRYNQYDLLISQIYPKEMIDGIAIVQTLRLGHYSKENQNIPAIAHTTINLPKDKEACLKAGFNSYVTMPPNSKHELTDEILRLLSQSDPIEESGHTICLHIEPRDSDRDIVRWCLSREFEQKINLLSFDSFELAEVAMQTQKVDFVICNTLFGLNFIRGIRTGVYGDEKKQLPAIAFTTHARVGKPNEYLGAGFNAHIALPEILMELPDTVRRLIPSLK